MRKPSVLVLDAGARGHAILEALRNDPEVGELYCHPGNGGISQVANLIDSKSPIVSSRGILSLASSFGVNLTIAGSDLFATAGARDEFIAAKRLLLAPTLEAAKLESSKAFAKEFMARHGIPTARFNVADTVKEALLAAYARSGHCVIKADGLCRHGLGVHVCSTMNEAKRAIKLLMMRKVQGKAGEIVVVEDRLYGVEVSMFLLCDGNTCVEFGTAGDHKRAFDDDKGPNTGGVGAYAPSPLLTQEMKNRFIEEVGQIVVRKTGFVGILFIGLILTANGPMVIEFNVRLGDPEAQVILPLIDSPLYPVFLNAADGRLSGDLRFKPLATVGVVLSSRNYPYEENPAGRPKLISGPVTLDQLPHDIRVYHSATVQGVDGRFYALDGRVLTVVGIGESYYTAQQRAYQHIAQIRFEGMRYRRDIGKNILLHQLP